MLALAAAGEASVRDHRWCSHANEHFDLVTDLGRRRATELYLALDRFRAAASAVLPGAPPGRRVPLKILVFKRASDFANTFEYPNISGFMQPSLAQSLLALGPDDDGRYLHANAYHEYTHYLLRSRAALNLPIWYEEGLATYLSTIDIDETGTVTLGRGPAPLLRYLVKQPRFPVRELLSERFRLDWQRHDLDNVYMLAWGVVRFLHHARRPDGSRYADDIGAMLAAIDAGAKSLDALHSEVGIAPEALAERMRDYFTAGDLAAQTVYRYRIDYYDPPPMTRRCLSSGEGRVALADALTAHRPAEAVALYDAVLAQVPGDVAALVGLSRATDDRARAVKAAEAAVQAAPDSAEAQVRLAQVRVADCPTLAEDCGPRWQAAARHYRRALELDPERADAAYGLGVLDLVNGRPETALEHLESAHHSAPFSPQINFYLGEAFRQSGDVPSARAHLRKTAAWHPDASWRDRAERRLDTLDEIPE